MLGFFNAREGRIYKILAPLSFFSILFFGKLFILEAVNFVFGDHVELGHFIEIVSLILAGLFLIAMFGGAMLALYTVLFLLMEV